MEPYVSVKSSVFIFSVLFFQISSPVAFKDLDCVVDAIFNHVSLAAVSIQKCVNDLLKRFSFHSLSLFITIIFIVHYFIRVTGKWFRFILACCYTRPIFLHTSTGMSVHLCVRFCAFTCHYGSALRTMAYSTNILLIVPSKQ